MATLASKSIEALELRDIQDLLGASEGQSLEFKQELTFDQKSGKSEDSWLNPPAPGKPRSGPDDYAKEDLFRAVCGFANAEGGWLVLGIDESNDNPKCGVAIRSLPDAHALAEKLERAALDWFDPPLTSIRCRAIDTDPGFGVVVIRTPRSSIAPHRLNKSGRTRESYRRVNEETRPMRMREIHDMVINRARESVRIEEDFVQARQHYGNLLPTQSPQRRIPGCQIILTPLSDQLSVDRPYAHSHIFRRHNALKCVFPDGKELIIESVDGNVLTKPVSITPILRGARAVWRHATKPLGAPLIENMIALEIRSTGQVSLTLKQCSGTPALMLQWILSDLANTLRVVDAVRRLAGAPDAEFALEADLRYDNHGNTLENISANPLPRLGLLADEEPALVQRMLPTGFIHLPRYTVTSSNLFPNVLLEVANDIYNLCGNQHLDGIEFQLG
ncbi:AlbA family DNA-binding domain-containing protein [Skermanella stibiiresistens]|uniref:AlbA family DNA-binding domain-containing protein n=1 Tax=Skermanella stibiiresistens TaxID=913326 RepID=UPI0004AFCB96|nr:ATP-binding protein [Skermanella stibiiresistens]